MPRYFADKESFGDADVLVPNWNFQGDIKQKLIEVFEPKEIIKNGNVYSFEYKELQIDAILVKKEHWESSYNYYSWNDLGNLMGRIAHKFGLKYGWDGLRYVYRGNGKIMGEYSVSTDINEICKFLDLDSDVFNKGFSSLNEIFDFVTKSKFFNPNYYDMDELNRINRDRNKKRTTYQTFLSLCSDLKKQDHWYKHDRDKNIYLGHIDASFPGFLQWYREIEADYKLTEEAKTKFNGSMVMELLPELRGQDLGRAINNFVIQLGFENNPNGLRDYYLQNTTFDIMYKFVLINTNYITIPFDLVELRLFDLFLKDEPIKSEIMINGVLCNNNEYKEIINDIIESKKLIINKI